MMLAELPHILLLTLLLLIGCEEVTSEPSPSSPAAEVEPSSEGAEPVALPASEPLDLSDDVAVRRRAIGETGGNANLVGDRHAARCLTRPAPIEDVVVVGSFAHDRGCRLLGIFVGQDFHRDRRAAAEAVLARPEFGQADAENKRQIAAAVVREVLHAFSGAASPDAQSSEDGSVSVTVTTRRPGKRRGDPVEHSYRIAADGTLSGS